MNIEYRDGNLVITGEKEVINEELLNLKDISDGNNDFLTTYESNITDAGDENAVTSVPAEHINDLFRLLLQQENAYQSILSEMDNILDDMISAMNETTNQLEIISKENEELRKKLKESSKIIYLEKKGSENHPATLF